MQRKCCPLAHGQAVAECCSAQATLSSRCQPHTNQMSHVADVCHIRIVSVQAVTGAGAAGLVAARELVREGHRVTVFEKGS